MSAERIIWAAKTHIMYLSEVWEKQAWANSLDPPIGLDKRGYLGPVVQSVVSLTSSLRVISLTILADSIYNILIFFAEKMWVAFALQKLLLHCKSYSHFFSKKFQHICVSLDVNFNESLTNDVVSFEQPGPGKYFSYFLMKTYVVCTH